MLIESLCNPEWFFPVACVGFVVLFISQLFHLSSLDKYFENPEIRPIQTYGETFKKPVQSIPEKINVLSFLKLRLRAYAKLSECDANDCGEAIPEDHILLGKNAHRILLGTLKKIEAKNAALISLAAILVGVGAILASLEDHQKLPAMHLAFVFLGLLTIVPMYQLFRGIKQVDQYDFYFEICFDDSNMAKAMKALQLGLMHDLLTKERAFRFAKFWVGLISFILLMIVIFQFSLPALCAY
ncbi:MAG: hypothetical protein JJU08_18035 [Rhodobacteraceae bacterium]|nr:hypothetical protein [Paracoccaceae bacterium]